MSVKKNMTWAQGKAVHYLETGKSDGDPIIFLNGEGESPGIWREALPYLERSGRCIALDVFHKFADLNVRSSRLQQECVSFKRQYCNLHAVLAAAGVSRRVTLILDGTAEAIGFLWAAQNPQLVRALVYSTPIRGVWTTRSSGRYSGKSANQPYPEMNFQGPFWLNERRVCPKFESLQWLLHSSTPKLLIAPAADLNAASKDIAGRNHVRNQMEVALPSTQRPLPSSLPEEFGAAVATFLDCIS